MKECFEREKIIKLFSPWEKNGVKLKNRFVRAATYLAACDAETGHATRDAIGRQIETAAGGAAVVISEYAYISQEGKSAVRQWGIYNDSAIEDVKALADGVHIHDTKLIVQICHAGSARADVVNAELPLLSPSGITHPGRNNPSTAMTKDDIKKAIDDFAAAALRAKKGGADGVEIHGAHGFLIMQFLSPLLNKRNDEYGGSDENRMRFAKEVYSAVRSACGNDFKIWIKISITEGIEGGYDKEYGIKTALAMFDEGVDAVEISSGASYSKADHIPSVAGVFAGVTEAPFAEYAHTIRAATSKEKLVILTGGLRSLPVLAALLDDGITDLFAMSRPFIAEPDLINRWAEDDARPSACFSCNACFRRSAVGIIDCPIMREKQEGDWDPL